MTGLEQQLLIALDRLSKQYAQEQAQQRQHIDYLSQQVTKLSKQQNELLTRYEQVIAILREDFPE